MIILGWSFYFLGKQKNYKKSTQCCCGHLTSCTLTISLSNKIRSFLFFWMHLKLVFSVEMILHLSNAGNIIVHFMYCMYNCFMKGKTIVPMRQHATSMYTLRTVHCPKINRFSVIYTVQ